VLQILIKHAVVGDGETLSPAGCSSKFEILSP
jgi:hypothetical protein